MWGQSPAADDGTARVPILLPNPLVVSPLAKRSPRPEPAPRERRTPRRDREAALQLAADSQAIERVLQAERDAEADVEHASNEAEALVAEARQEARRIAERADQRVRWLRNRLSNATDDAIADLQREHVDRARASERSLADPGLLDAAVRRVATWLLGEEGSK